MFVTMWYLYLISGGGIDLLWWLALLTAGVDIVIVLGIMATFDKWLDSKAPGPDDI